jgi:hypothetical protein
LVYKTIQNLTDNVKSGKDEMEYIFSMFGGYEEDVSFLSRIKDACLQAGISL